VTAGLITDLGGNHRGVDDPGTPNTGVGEPTILGDVFVDMGACEFAKCNNPPGMVRADFDEDGDVDGIDFATFASCFNKAGNPPRTLNCPKN
jgi:hypothetical protein